MPMDPCYDDGLEHLDIHGDISAPSGRVMRRPLESQFGLMLCAALLTNISLKKKEIKYRGMEMWRARRSNGGRKGEEIDPSIGSGERRGRRIHHPAGMFCSDINFGPEPVANEHILWQMGEPEELKHCRGTFARQQTAVTPPGVWRQRKTRGECVSPEEPITAVLLEPFNGLCSDDKRTHNQLLRCPECLNIYWTD